MEIKNTAGLSFHFHEGGSLGKAEAGKIRIGSGANLYLRKRSSKIEFIPLTGGENSTFASGKDYFISKGSWNSTTYECRLVLSPESMSWQWIADIINTSEEPAEFDIILVLNVGLKDADDGLVNEYYVAQYIERRIIEDKIFGHVICCRQNMAGSTGNPWMMTACRTGAVAASTDGMIFFGKTFRETGIPAGLLTDKLRGEYAGESPVVALQEKPFRIDPGESHRSIFISTFFSDHPAATSEDDTVILSEIIKEFDKDSEPGNDLKFQKPVRNIFTDSNFLLSEDLNDEELNTFFGHERRNAEFEDEKLLSFFCDNYRHVALRSKELITDRPHGHIIQANNGFFPDEGIVSTTSFAFGVFNSHITQGNTNFNILLSVCNSQFNQDRETGQRIFIKKGGQYFLFGVPSAFEMGLNHCRWIYKSGEDIFQVRTWTSKNHPQINMDFSVLRGGKSGLIITNNFDRSNNWIISHNESDGSYIAKPSAGTMISGKFPEAKFRIILNRYGTGFKEFLETGKNDFLNFNVDETDHFSMSFLAEVNTEAEFSIVDDDLFDSDCSDAVKLWNDLSLELELDSENEDIKAVKEILPWFSMNALTHYLTPYGLEQFSGAAWGTRDISQGPFDLLLSNEKYDAAKKILKIIFSNQEPGGGWPQWWMFDSYREIRADSSHGDIYYWCILALCSYIEVTGDLEILDEKLPYYPKSEASAVREQIDRLISMITGSFIKNTALVPFGGGDWNDSLQPVSQDLARRMISSWTVEMNYQAFSHYSKICRVDNNPEKASELENLAEKIKSDFNKYLVRDGIVAGYGMVMDNGSIDLLLHPKDKMTVIQYSLLPMNRGIISGIFTPEQAEIHQEIIKDHLMGPDGARLMDRPLKYRGGIQSIFRRAESSTWFGREIGLMYVHEHIRYAESQAILGKAEEFIHALRQADPVGYRDVVSCADHRQSNCYYSSSDVAFRNRYEADERYDDVISGKLMLRGGWRVYSSGPGIFTGLIITRLLGLRIQFGNIIVDPVMPLSFDGLSASLKFLGRRVTFIYRLKEGSFSPRSILINGKEISTGTEENPYRKGGATIPGEYFLGLTGMDKNIIEVLL